MVKPVHVTPDHKPTMTQFFFLNVPLVAFPVTICIPVVSWPLIRTHHVKNYPDPHTRRQVIIDFPSKDALKSKNNEIFIINHIQVIEITHMRWPVCIQVHAYELYGPTMSTITPMYTLEHNFWSF